MLSIRTIFPFFVLMFCLSACTKKQVAVHVFACPDTLKTADIRGVNWADERDNYVDGWLFPSGITSTDDYASVMAKANTVLSGFRTNLGANTVRLPVNPQTVLQSWWPTYTGTIDAAINSNMHVILACWEGAAHKDGMIDDTAQFQAMWQVVVNKYINNDSVYFEIFNEPFGYTIAEWQTICVDWLRSFPQVPRCRILIGGISYDDFVTVMGHDSAFNGCLLSQHIYPWWGNFDTPSDWETALQSRVNPYQNRTILTEFGAPMTTGLNYGLTATSDTNITFIQGITTQLRNYNMGSCYWPGLRNNDFYSIQLLRNDSMITTNASAVIQLQKGWGL